MNASQERRGWCRGAPVWITVAALACVSPRDAPRREGVLCTGCEAAWFLDEAGDLELGEYRTLNGMQCGSCRSAVRQFFVTGELRHYCAICDTNLKRCVRMQR